MTKSNYQKVKEWRAQPENKAKVAAQAKRWRERNPDARQAIVERHREANTDHIRELNREAQQRRRTKDPEGARRRQLEYKARQEALLIEQAGRPRSETCELCGEMEKTVFDHSHQQGHFRGWLCQRCNRVLGSVGDDPDLLRKMATYLEQTNGTSYSAGEKTSC